MSDDENDFVDDEIEDADPADIEIGDNADAVAESDEEDEEDIDSEHKEDIKIEPNEYIVIKPENRITPSIISRNELTEIRSIRGTQISHYNNCFVPIGELDNPSDMAEKELRLRKCPLLIQRDVGFRIDNDGKMVACVELWNPNEMTIPDHL